MGDAAAANEQAMFFHLQLEREIELQPRFFGPRLAEVLHQKLRTEVSCCITSEVMQASAERKVLADGLAKRLLCIQT